MSEPWRPTPVTTTDYHTAGEPFRIVTGGVPVLPGATILEKRRWAAEHLDEVRRLLVFEPRGHADMYGCFVTEPEDGGADLGVVFFHNAGYSTACGHGTIALVTWALDEGRIEPAGRETRVVVDVPSGRVETAATVEDGRVTAVRFRNVPSYVHTPRLQVAVEGRELAVAVAYGGAFYALLPATDVGLRVTPGDLTELVGWGRAIKAAIDAEHPVAVPGQPDIHGIYGVMFTEEDRNLTVFADGEVDRSPCGSGTSARLAQLDATGALPRGETLAHRSIIDSVFLGRVVGEAPMDGRPAVITEITGRAHPTGRHTFVLDERDELGPGFLLR